MWVVVKFMLPFWFLSRIPHVVFRDPKGDHNFDNHPCAVEGDRFADAEVLVLRGPQAWGVREADVSG